jgi:thiamine-phosphate pyrophosphorylase
MKTCRDHNVKLIINDNVELAKTIGSDGVHLGKSDMNPADARKILGENVIIGGTANTFEDIERLAKQNVNYIGLGPFRFTSTKKNLSPVLGLEGYENILKQCRANGIRIPVIAIGGITVADVNTLTSIGLYGIAVSSAINLSTDFKKSVDNFKHELKSHFSIDHSNKI